ncbi:DUF2267 domain-containing protein [Marinicauda algicola]|uniref:DUF2267 domain-containing protein n=1 Tax=Marinicauda algicola TaxID=2029849 RepID=A0A4S2GZB8_9PROT|nr:DUF2267 domain-containing protein [Marinicauda algicola]TGY88557.1 DUF2267 domain-containing protein [Marinicauda algicola]
MSATQVRNLDDSIHRTNEWLRDLQEKLGADDRGAAYIALRGVLKALRDRLPTDDAAHLGAQLPIPIRGVYYDQYRPSDQPNVVREPEIFLSMIGDGFGDANNLGFGPEEAARAVFELLNEKIDTNEAQKARHILNDELKAFWPKAA